MIINSNTESADSLFSFYLFHAIRAILLDVCNDDRYKPTQDKKHFTIQL